MAGDRCRYDYEPRQHISPWKQLAGRYTREGDVGELLARPTTFRRLETGRRAGAGLRGRRTPGAIRLVDADLPALRLRLQQGDGSQLGQPRPGGTIALPRHVAVPVRVAGALPRHAGAPRLRRALQHTRRGAWDPCARDTGGGGRSRTSPRCRRAPHRQGPAVMPLRYAVAACQTDFACPLDRAGCASTPTACCAMIDARGRRRTRRSCPCGWSCSRSSRTRRPSTQTVAGAARAGSRVPIPNEHTDRLRGQGPRARRLHPDRDVPRGRRRVARASCSTRRA